MSGNTRQIDCMKSVLFSSPIFSYFWKMLQHLKHQQEGLSHLIATIKSDLQDLKLIEQGLQETMSQR